MSSPDGAPTIAVELAEWDQVGPARDEHLRNVSLKGDAAAQHMAERLRDRLDIREGYVGLEIASTSFVGRVAVGRLRIAVQPKLDAMPLTSLLRYAYGLRDLGPLLETTWTPMARQGLHDLLAAMLAAEVEDLLHRGLARHYVPLEAALESPRGRILVPEIVRRGGVREARLPCRHVERRADWTLNQVLRAGLGIAAALTEDAELRRRMHRLAASFGDVASRTGLTEEDFDKAEQRLTRLTAAYTPALAIIRLLLDAQGLDLERMGPPQRTPGFLFDMNVFFQRLLSRFLHDNLPADWHIQDERHVRGVLAYAPDANPRCRSAPALKPDYALFHGGALKRFLDAKYRDVWHRGCPAGWLYQLSTYALASPDRVSVLLYASMAADASDERVNVRSPLSRSAPASVILRPVELARLAELVRPDPAGKRAAERQLFAERLTS